MEYNPRLKFAAIAAAAASAPVFKLVDTCAAEFEAATPCYYSTYDQDVMRPASASSLESSSWAANFNRIGQGIDPLLLLPGRLCTARQRL